MKKISLIVVCVLGLSACGQGGGESPVNDQTQTISPEDNSAVKTADLKTSSDFDFNSTYILKLEIVQQQLVESKFYINICSDFNTTNEGYQVNYDSCLLRTRINESNREFEIVLSHNEKKLIAQIWTVEYGAKPVNQFWKKIPGEDEWQILVRI